MHIIYNADSAATGTWSYATLSFTDITSGDNAVATFAGYKNAAGIIEVSKMEDHVLVYPNPACNDVDVLFTPGADVKTIAVYNIIGRLLNMYKVSSNTSAHCEFNADMPPVFTCCG